jgi:sulfatase modifying factor 1
MLACGSLACAARTASNAPAPTVASDPPGRSESVAASPGDQRPPPSCAAGGPGMTDCGVAHENCCTSLEVPGGRFFSIYGPKDGGDGGLADEMINPRGVSSFRLDKYDVTVGRYRQFIQAWKAGYRPGIGSGKHTHLHGGGGLAAQNDRGYEQGWRATDEGKVEPTTEHLMCNVAATWTPAPGRQETLPINCVNWYEAYAFCIWDGGFLPSTAEWNYAAAGGSEQRPYPWGTAKPGTASQYAFYDCHYPLGPAANCHVVKAVDFTAANVAPVGLLPLGAGRWGQLDLEGNMGQWTLDGLTYEPCDDCGFWSQERRGCQGADFSSFPASVLRVGGYGGGLDAAQREDTAGVRCARTP